MNKVVPSIIAMSALLITAGCTSSGVKGNAYSGVSAHNGAYANHSSRAVYQGGQFQQAACQNCGQGSHAVSHDHGHSRATTGQTVTHRHTGVTGHAHNGLSGSHSYVTTTAGRNGGGFVANNGGFVNTAVRGGAVRTGGGVGSTIAKAAGALLIGGLIYKAADDNNDSGSSGGSTGGSTGGDDK